MKQAIIDIIGLVGLGLLGFGLYGVDPRLSAGVIGMILMAYAFYATKSIVERPSE